MYQDDQGNPRTSISWNAPTQNTDGSPITDQLTYNLYVDNVNTASFPGTLNPDGKYSFLLADLPVISQPGSYQFELTAQDESGDESDRSNAITIVRGETIPNAPTSFAAG